VFERLLGHRARVSLAHDTDGDAHASPASPVRGGNYGCLVGRTLAAYSMASATRSQSSATRSFSPMEAKSRPAPQTTESRSPSKAPL
jgi:hypothetical protein